MEKISHKGYKILYEKRQFASAYKIIQMIQKYSTILSADFPKKISLSKPVKGYVWVEDLNELFIRILEKIMDNKDMIDDEDETAFLFQILLEKYDEDNEYDRQTVFDLQTIFCLCGLTYFQSAEDYYHYLQNPTVQQDIQIVDSLREKHREDLYNSILDSHQEGGETLEEGYIHIITNFLKKKRDYVDRFIKNYPKEIMPLTPLSEEELKELFKRFLKEIDPTEELIQLFEEGIQKNRIHFYESQDPVDENESVVKTPGIITLYCNGCMNDFRILAHEFAHYLLMNKGDIPKFSLSEFLSIFLELEAVDFLERNGLSQEECEAIRNIREKSLLDIYTGVTELFIQIDEKKKGIGLTAEWIYQTLREFYDQKEEEFSIEDAKTLMDDYTIDLVQEGSKLMERPTYLVGYYYAKKLQEEKDKYQKFDFILNHMSEYDMERLEQELKGDAKVFTKNENECDIMG